MIRREQCITVYGTCPFPEPRFGAERDPSGVMLIPSLAVWALVSVLKTRSSLKSMQWTGKQSHLVGLRGRVNCFMFSQIKREITVI